MNYIYSVFTKIGMTLIMGTGIHLVFSQGGIFFLGFTTVVGTSAYTLAIAQYHGIQAWIGFLMALFTSILMGILFSYLYIKVSNEIFVVISFASYFAFESLIISWNEVTNGILGLSGIIRPEIFRSTFNLTLGVIIISLILFLLEFLLLSSPLGRAIRAMKENPIALSVLAISSNKIACFLIITSCLCFSIGASFSVWQIQFVNTNFGAWLLLIELLTISIISTKPKMRIFAFGVLFVVLIPEFLRFLNLPNSIFGNLRILIYSVFLIVLIGLFKNKINTVKRTI